MAKNKRGGRRPGAGAPKGLTPVNKGPEKKAISARVLVATHEALERRAEAAGRTISTEVALILEEAAGR